MQTRNQNFISVFQFIWRQNDNNKIWHKSFMSLNKTHPASPGHALQTHWTLSRTDPAKPTMLVWNRATLCQVLNIWGQLSLEGISVLERSWKKLDFKFSWFHDSHGFLCLIFVVHNKKYKTPQASYKPHFNTNKISIQENLSMSNVFEILTTALLGVSIFRSCC